MALIVIGIWVLSWIAVIWVWGDASDRYESSIGCLWALMVLALGPIALLAYLLVRPSDWDRGEPTYQRPPSRRENLSATKPCPKCGSENPWNARHCGSCGAEFPSRAQERVQPQTSIRKVCSGCGHSNPGSAHYCNQCGQRLGEE